MWLCTTVLLFVAPCAVVRPWEAMVIGPIGGLIALGGIRLLNKLKIDDPVGAVSVHGLAGIWVRITSINDDLETQNISIYGKCIYNRLCFLLQGVVSVGLFMNEDTIYGLNNGQVSLTLYLTYMFINTNDSFRYAYGEHI